MHDTGSGSSISVGPVTTSALVAPATTRTYTLTAVNANGSVTAQTTVSVAQPDVTPSSVPASLVTSAKSKEDQMVIHQRKLRPGHRLRRGRPPSALGQ